MHIYTSIGHTGETFDYLPDLPQACWTPDALSHAVFGDDAQADAATTSVLSKDHRRRLLRQRRSYVDHDHATVPETLNTSRVLQHAAAMLWYLQIGSACAGYTCVFTSHIPADHYLEFVQTSFSHRQSRLCPYAL